MTGRSVRVGTVDVVAVTVKNVDLWREWEGGRWAVIPTNRQRLNSGGAVMGAGLAAQAARRVPSLIATYGAALARGEDRFAVGSARLLLVPTKDHWRNPSTLADVRRSIDAVARYASTHPVGLVVPALGCGLGGLEWDTVRPVLLDALDGLDAIVIPPH